jgi:hypothetical protein
VDDEQMIRGVGAQDVGKRTVRARRSSQQQQQQQQQQQHDDEYVEHFRTCSKGIVVRGTYLAQECLG